MSQFEKSLHHDLSGVTRDWHSRDMGQIGYRKRQQQNFTNLPMCPYGYRDYVPMILCVELIHTDTIPKIK